MQYLISRPAPWSFDRYPASSTTSLGDYIKRHISTSGGSAVATTGTLMPLITRRHRELISESDRISCIIPSSLYQFFCCELNGSLICIVLPVTTFTSDHFSSVSFSLLVLSHNSIRFNIFCWHCARNKLNHILITCIAFKRCLLLSGPCFNRLIKTVIFLVFQINY